MDDRGEVSPNGYYRLADGSIHIDLNADENGRDTMVYTLSHEIVHFLRRHNSKGYRTFANLLVEWYEGKGVHVEDLVDAQMEGHGYSWEVAFEEVVANSCETLLTDSNFVLSLTELRSKSKETFRQIRKTVLKFIDWVRCLYKDIDPENEEGSCSTRPRVH